jgi:hypothetical protein
VVPESQRWVKFSLINLTIVALLGTIMRYKIGFSLPLFEQKFLQEAHSHFAFTGWITHTLFFLVVNVFRSGIGAINESRYRRLIVLNLLIAYGMLFSFLVQGYGPVSIFFSTLSLIISYVFSWFALKDAARLESGHPGKNWIKGALWLGIISTLGTMVLSWMMATRHYDQTTYLGSIYFYLHFQYNGWFIFGCFGLFMSAIRNFPLSKKEIAYPFLLFTIAAVPAYFLSTLWANIPWWLYVFVVMAALLQAAGWFYFVRMIKRHLNQLKTTFNKTVRLLFLGVALAFTLKIFLQLGSTIPHISKLAYGFRPIVIAYLHLVLLLIVSVFLLSFMFGNGLITSSRTSKIALVTFTVSAILNEVVLAVQGIFSFSYTVVPYINESLFIISCMLLLSAALLAFSQTKTDNPD